MKSFTRASLASGLAALTVLTGLATPHLANAAVTIDTSQSAPVLNHIYKYRDVAPTETAANVLVYRYSPSSFRAVAQVFNTSGESSSISITGVTFNISNFSTDVLGKEFSLSIYKNSSATASPADQNSERIFYDTGTLPDALAINDYISFRFSAPQTLEAKQYYTVVFDFLDTTGTSGGLYLKTVGTNNSNTPLNRMWASTSAGSWGYFSATNGFVMYVHTAAAVPEASTATLLLGTLVAGSGLHIIRRRRA